MDVKAMLFTRLNGTPTAQREQRDLSTTVKITDPSEGGRSPVSMEEAVSVDMIVSVSGLEKLAVYL